MTAPDRRTLLLGVLMSSALLGTVLVHGWVCDDAFITLRAVRRVLAGEGATWNPGERVQVFTHPLWAALLVPAHALTGSGWWAALGLGLAATAVFVAGLASRATTGAVIALALLLGSRSFVDFSTGGLENPLLHVLLAALVLWPRAAEPRIGGLLAGLALLTRLDAAPLVLLVLAGRLAPGRRLRGVSWAAAPPLLWFGASLFWFGALLPNPALAKLGAAIPKAEVINQGLQYLATSAVLDPLGAALLVVGVITCLARRDLRWAGAGIFAQVAWIAWAGGDFMVGRFLTPALAVSAAALATTNPRMSLTTPAVAAAILATALVPDGTLRWPDARGLAKAGELIDEHGIVDERRYYTPGSALVGWRPGRSMPQHRFRDRGEGADPNEVLAPIAVGFTGYFCDPGVFIVDRTGVTDPFLARLPARPGSRRPGHLYRDPPFGYREWIADSTCALREVGLETLCDDVRLATRAPLLAPGRGGAVARLLLGDAIQVLTGRRPTGK